MFRLLDRLGRRKKARMAEGSRIGKLLLIVRRKIQEEGSLIFFTDAEIPDLVGAHDKAVRVVVEFAQLMELKNRRYREMFPLKPSSVCREQEIILSDSRPVNNHGPVAIGFYQAVKGIVGHDTAVIAAPPEPQDRHIVFCRLSHLSPPFFKLTAPDIFSRNSCS